jgi:signal transduction histidine kinase
LNVMTEKLGDYESQLAERSRLAALGEMSARIAHEIRNPLTGLKLNLQLLDERASGDDRARVRRLLDEVARLELIVASSLAMTRPPPARLRPDDLNAVIGDVLHLMEPSLRHLRIELVSELATLPTVSMDADRIKQVILNLLVNASDAMPEGGRILVRTGTDEQRRSAFFSVEDSGPGLSPELLDSKSPAGASTKPFGLGLGLRVCRDIVDEHGGELHVGRSPSLGGAQLTIEFPLGARA